MSLPTERENSGSGVEELGVEERPTSPGIPETLSRELGIEVRPESLVKPPLAGESTTQSPPSLIQESPLSDEDLGRLSRGNPNDPRTWRAICLLREKRKEGLQR